MKAIFFTITFILSSTLSFSQSGWYTQLNQQSTDFQDFYFLNSQTGWVVGYSGTIFKTTNGGNNWIQHNISSAYQLTNVTFINSNTGFASGFTYDIYFEPVLFKTTDGGNTWNLTHHIILGSYRNICFINEETGFIPYTSFGNYLFKTTNSGATWNETNSNLENNFSLNYIQYINSNTGFISCYKVVDSNSPIINRIIKTTDSGKTWFVLQTDTVPYSNSNFNRKVHFFDENTGYLQRGNLFKTTNAGLSFFQLSTGFINSFYFPVKDTGWCVGYSGKLIKTIDGGQSWTNQNIASNTDIFPVFFIDSKTGWAGGYIGGGGGGLIIHTVTGGLNSINSSPAEISVRFILNQNYPNPFNPSTVISYSLPERSDVRIIIYDVQGKELKTLVDEPQSAGNYETTFYAKELSSGIYFYSLYANGNKIETRKMTILK